VTLLPAATEDGEAVLVVIRSACVDRATTSAAVALLFAVFGSAIAEFTVAVSLIAVPAAVPRYFQGNREAGCSGRKAGISAGDCARAANSRSSARPTCGRADGLEGGVRRRALGKTCTGRRARASVRYNLCVGDGISRLHWNRAGAIGDRQIGRACNLHAGEALLLPELGRSWSSRWIRFA